MNEDISDFTKNLLKRLNIQFGLQPNPLDLGDVDVDPTLSLVSHIWECVAALKVIYIFENSFFLML